MSRFRNYWVYSAGLAVVWAIVLILVFTTRGPAVGQVYLLIFAGYSIGWVTTTIARFVYPTTEAKSKREIMRCLKRYAAREIYRQITNPRPAPDNSDLRRMRTELGMTITTVAGELGQWVSIISRLERGSSATTLWQVNTGNG